MGVRISWLTLARNSSLARFADSADSFALAWFFLLSQLSGRQCHVRVPNQVENMRPDSPSQIGVPRVLNQR